MKNPDIKKYLFKSSSVIFLINIAGTLISFLLQLMLAKIMPIEEFGYYVYVITWINFLVLVAKMGLDVSTLKYLPQFIIKKEYSRYWGFVSFTTRYLFYTSLAMMLILILSVMWLPIDKKELVEIFISSSLLIPILVFSQVIGSQLQVFKKLALSVFVQNLFRPFVIVVVLLVVYYCNLFDGTAVSVIVVNIIVSMVILYYLYLSKKSIDKTPSKSIKIESFNKEWLSVSIPMFLITSCNYLINQLDILMLGYFLGTKEAAIYAVASRITMFLQFVLTAVNGVVAPIISEYHASNKRSALLKIVKYAAWISAATTLPGALLIYVFSEDILLLFGEEFKYANTSMLILALARIVNSLTGVSGYLLSMTGNHLIALRVLMLSLILNFILNSILIPAYGMEGAAISTVVSSMIWGILMSFFSIKYLKINPTIFGYGK